MHAHTRTSRASSCTALTAESFALTGGRQNPPDSLTSRAASQSPWASVPPSTKGTSPTPRVTGSVKAPRPPAERPAGRRAPCFLFPVFPLVVARSPPQETDHGRGLRQSGTPGPTFLAGPAAGTRRVALPSGSGRPARLPGTLPRLPLSPRSREGPEERTPTSGPLFRWPSCARGNCLRFSVPAVFLENSFEPEKGNGRCLEAIPDWPQEWRQAAECGLAFTSSQGSVMGSRSSEPLLESGTRPMTAPCHRLVPRMASQSWSKDHPQPAPSVCRKCHLLGLTPEPLSPASGASTHEGPLRSSPGDSSVVVLGAQELRPASHPGPPHYTAPNACQHPPIPTCVPTRAHGSGTRQQDATS